MIEIVEKSIIEADTKYIAHQCNCVTQASAGTARAIFDAFPYSNTYKDRADVEYKSLEDGNRPGQILIMGDGEKNRYVINMLAQVFPGPPKFPLSKMDGTAAREGFFKECLSKVEQIRGLTSIAFPYGIGCNLGGGDWDAYLKMLENFENRVNAKVYLYRIGK